MCGNAGREIGAVLGGPVGWFIGNEMEGSADRAKRDMDKLQKDNKAANDAMLAEINKPKPTMVDPLVDPSEKNKRLRALRYGLLSTIKTSPRGVSNVGGKTKLGA